MAHPLWPDPHLSGASTAVLAVAVVVWSVVTPLRGRVRYRRLVAERAAGVPGALTRMLRRTALVQVAVIVAVVVLVAALPGLRRRDAGLRLPTGDQASFWWGWTVTGCVVVLVSGIVLRRRALSGRGVPGQRMVRALLPDTADERRWAAVVSVGAGVSEELLYRGLFTATAMAVLGVGAAVASVVVMALFGLVHAYQGVLGVVGTAVVGGLMSYVYLQTGSLLLPMVVHAVIDLRGLVLVPAVQGAMQGAVPVPEPVTRTDGRAVGRSRPPASPVVDDGPPRLP